MTPPSSPRAGEATVAAILERIYIERDFFNGNETRAKQAAADDARDFDTESGRAGEAEGGVRPTLIDAVQRHSTDPVAECDDGSHHVLGLAINVIEARPSEGTCDHCGQMAPCTERRIAVAFVEVMRAALASSEPDEEPRKSRSRRSEAPTAEGGES